MCSQVKCLRCASDHLSSINSERSHEPRGIAKLFSLWVQLLSCQTLFTLVIALFWAVYSYKELSDIIIRGRIYYEEFYHWKKKRTFKVYLWWEHLFLFSTCRRWPSGHPAFGRPAGCCEIPLNGHSQERSPMNRRRSRSSVTAERRDVFEFFGLLQLPVDGAAVPTWLGLLFRESMWRERKASTLYDAGRLLFFPVFCLKWKIRKDFCRRRGDALRIPLGGRTLKHYAFGDAGKRSIVPRWPDEFMENRWLLAIAHLFSLKKQTSAQAVAVFCAHHEIN